jgi:acetyltransferase-like isoleucine patch superfamily enzyme/acyl carrier protein
VTATESSARRRGVLRRVLRPSAVERLRAAATNVGGEAVVVGRATIVNRGRIDVGGGFVLSSQPLASHLIVDHGGELLIGDRVRIGFGAAIACERRIRIGDDSTLGPYVSLADSDFHVVGDRDARPEPRPVEIGRRVVVGARVTILPGTTIGDDVEVAAGSVVGGTVPAGDRVAGVPARPVTAAGASGSSPAEAVLDLVQRTLALPARPARGEARAAIAEWDSLGALRILVALEEDLGVQLGEADVLEAATVGDLVDAVVARGGGQHHRGVAAGDRPAAVAELVRAALDLPAPPPPTADRDAIPEWDSFGALKILLAAEDRFGVTLAEEQVAAARSVADLLAVIQRAG